MKKYKNKKDVTSEMIGMNVISNYGFHRTYRIDDIKWDLTPEYKFMLKNGKEVNILLIIDIIN